MRFRFKPIIFSLLCSFAHPASANEDLHAQRMDNTLIAQVQPAQDAPAVVEADRLSGRKDSQIEAEGNAILRKGGQSIRADRLLYSQDTQDLDAQGSVVLEQDGSTMSGPHLRFNLDTGAGVMEQPEFYLKENDARGSADVMHIEDRLHYTLEKATYTTCPAGNNDWLLNMEGLEIDRDRQIGTAHHTRAQFMGVPILYTPWMDFPLNNQRKSGFLAPVFGGTVKGGSEFTLPYYWNIAANRDATIAPRFMLKRGLMLNNEFRYMGAGYAGEVQADALPHDALVNRSRERVSLKHHQALTGGLSGYIDFNRVSDDDYFRDLAGSINATSQVNLMREGVLSYQTGLWTTAARAQHFQTLQDPSAPIVAPYARLPQVTVGTQQVRSGANLTFAGEYVDFSHPTLLSGRRMVLNPGVSYPLLNDPAVFVTPRIGLHSTYYALEANNPGGLQNASRTLPILSVDSGVAFEREGNLFGADYVNTLEPRAFYVFVPYRDQSLLPNFDSAQADFSFTQMFTENRFFGSDRIGDADQVTLAATTRWLEKSNGAERLKVTVGERFSFRTPQVNLVTPAASTNKSDILMAVTGQVTRAWSLDSEFQIDPNQSHTQRYNIAARYRPEAGKVLNLGYRFARNTLRQADVSMQWPVFNRWHAVGRWNYSLQDGRTLEAIAGLEYNQSCWTMRLVAQRFTTATQEYNTGLFMQLELNDLVKVGADPLTLLKQSVPGYTKLNDKPADNPAQVAR
ncbi:MAG: organic solvent tolerance protein [Betaproteobacteria bacterium RBG_16_56_24]|nr:MAG: organic solvent tolerance protein [Betaproteobacteria bacterium RBG_16_56_24]